MRMSPPSCRSMLPPTNGRPTVNANGKAVAQGKVPRTASLAFTANDAFDVGRDSYSPVSPAYFDRKPFAFNGTIDRLGVEYLK